MSLGHATLLPLELRKPLNVDTADFPIGRDPKADQ